MLSVALFVASIWATFVITSTEAVPHAYDIPSHPYVASRQAASLSVQLRTTVSEFRDFEEDVEAAQAFQQRLTNVSSRIDALSIIGNYTESRQRATVVCKISELLFPHVVITKDSWYKEEKEVNWSQTCWLPAACFIRPKNTLHVAAILKVVSYVEAKFAVRGGGHNPNAGFGSIGNNGVLIDMKDLNKLTMQEGQDNVLQTGSGLRWNEIYEYLGNRSLGAVGGRDGDVGVAGYLLGGGMSFFPNMYGLGADSVENYKCVLANSTFVNANATSNPDLFKELKGGGSNFAIVTEFHIRTHPIHNIWYSLDLFESSQYKAVLNATVQAQLAMETDPRMGMFVNVARGGILVGKFYAEWSLGPRGFAMFDALTPAVAYIPATNGTLYGLISALRAERVFARREPHVVSHGVDVELYAKVHEQYLQLLSSSTAASANLSYTIQPIGVAGVQAGEDRGGNPLGIQRVPQTWHASLVEWTSPEDEIAAHNLVQSFGTGVELLARARNSFYPYRFMNDASYTQNPLDSYGTANLASMNAVSAAYDPNGVFQRLQNAGFLVSRTQTN